MSETTQTTQDMINSLREKLDEAMETARKIDTKPSKKARTELRKTLQSLILESKEARKIILEGGRS